MSTQAAQPRITPLPSATVPLGLAVAQLILSGGAICLAAGNVQWSTHSADALPLAWSYVNVAVLWTTLAFWPAIALSRARIASPYWDAATLIVTAIPAFAVGALLSNSTLAAAMPTLATQLVLLLFALGAISWQTRIPRPLIAGTLTTLAVIAPILGYLWLEFLPSAPHTWLVLIPALAIFHGHWWPAIVYALAGSILLFTAPRAAKTN